LASVELYNEVGAHIEEFLGYRRVAIGRRRCSKTLQHPPRPGDNLEIGEQGDGDTYRQLRKLFDAAVEDKAKVEAKRLAQSIHSLQVTNEILHNREDGLVDALTTKSKPKPKRTITPGSTVL